MTDTTAKWPKPYSLKWWENRKRAIGHQKFLRSDERLHYHIVRGQNGNLTPTPDRALFAQVIEVEFQQPTHDCSPECPCGRMTDEERQKFFPA